jgi:threonine 3-dehydrogenase
MKAIVKARPEPNGTELQTVPVPKPGKNDVLIKLKTASICGTDVHIYNWDAWSQGRIKPPVIYGHEFAGEIIEIGEEVKNAKVGDYVSGECHIADWYCFNCQTGLAHICKNTKIFGVDVDGIFAEYAVIPATNVWHNDPQLPPEICSIQDPLGNAIHTIFAADVVGRDVAVLGVGPIGAMAVSVCKNIGAAQVFAVGRRNKYRTDLAKSVGADYVYLAEDDVYGDVLDKTDGKGVDVVLEMSGNVNAVVQGLELLRQGGTISLLGVYADNLTVDISKLIVFKYITMKGINGRLMWDTWHRMKGLLRNKKIVEDMKTIITHRYKFENFFEGMDTMRSGNSGKVTLNFED